MAKYLVTGGAGFIGSNIVKKLVEDGHIVRVLDNLATGKRKNLESLLSKIEFIEGDFTDLTVAKKAVEGIDFVLHQGAIPSVPRSVDDPIKTNNANILGTLNMLVASRDAKVKRFIYAASSSAYGDSKVMPKEESMGTAPKSPYAIQKLTGEEYCQVFYKLYGLETVCLRYFNVFGPNQDPESVYSAVIPLFIKKIMRNESPVIFGDGTTSRDFTFVENNVDANIRACVAPSIVSGEVINIACGYEISLNELVQKINKEFGTNIKPIYKDERVGDVKHSLADITKAEKLLGYKPIVNFDDGLRKTIEFYKNN
ncbi:MAG: UDP-glucose 4-epimerase [Parcubacteria group bacterium Gr01-1014_46]|nr:MAG: UDP-glucose 4-epimerase [Parcubacteria group bacterium Gr01-1014_46]